MRPSGGLDRSSAGDAFDALSDVLQAVRLKGAVFFDVEARAPWAAEAPPAGLVGPGIMPGVDHVIEYHVVTSGECWARVLKDETPPVLLSAGDVVAFPQGDAHVMASDPDLRAAPPDLDEYRPPSAPETLPVQYDLNGGGEQRTHLVCGFLGCDARPFNPLLSALPPMIHVRAQDGGEWMDRFLAFATLEAAAKRAGGASMLAKLGEIMFIDLVRRYLDGLPETDASWLAGLKDRQVGRALALLHQSPAEDWTLERLAKESGMSRSSLAERFTHYVGRPPMQYLALWRMQLAAASLASGEASVARIAAEVGYDSEAAFSRAFKRAVGVSPSVWREQRTV
jgi:AraC-like DNA-binding protein